MSQIESFAVNRAEITQSKMCTECGKWPQRAGSPGTLCFRCHTKTKQRKSKRKLHDTRRREGVCIQCGKEPPADGIDQCRTCMPLVERRCKCGNPVRGKWKHLCEICAKLNIDKTLANAAERRERAKKEGFCTRCLKRRSLANMKMCEECLEKNREAYQNNKETHLGRCKRRHQTAKGKAELQRARNGGDLDLCAKEANKDAQGRPLCVYSGKSMRISGRNGNGRMTAEHIDHELKGRGGTGNIDWDDGAHNWVGAEWSVNSSKKDNNLFSWWMGMHEFLNLRPLADILFDLDRLGKRLPTVPEECRERVVEEIAKG